MTKVRIKPRILDVVEDDGMWLDRSTMTYYSKEDVEEVDLPSNLDEAADSAAINAFPENKSYSTVYDRVVDYNAIDRKNYRDGFIAGSDWHKQQMMKDAVGGIFLKGIDGEMVFVESSALDIDPKSVRVGDKVKLIVIKAEEE